MSNLNSLQDNQDLAFFGKVNASISHELKNILAIISETAGLMTDLMELAGQGKQVDPETLMGCGRDIIEEIERGFVTIKQMNRFSHSVDNMVADVDIHALLELVIGLAGFLSFSGNVRLDRSSDESCVIKTSPFRLEHLAYTILVRMFRCFGPHSTVDVQARLMTDQSIEITFSTSDPPADGELSLEDIEGVAGSIDTTLHIGSDGQSIQLVLPLALD